MSYAASLGINNSSRFSFSGYDGYPTKAVGMENISHWNPTVAIPAGVFSATCLGYESGYLGGDHFDRGSALCESGISGTTIVGASVVSYGFADNSGFSRNTKKGDGQENPPGFAIFNGQASHDGVIDRIVGFNNGNSGDADNSDYAAGMKANDMASVSEPQTYAMILAGLGLLGFSVRRRRDDHFD